jgi:cytochrome c oxidase subunit 3
LYTVCCTGFTPVKSFQFFFGLFEIILVKLFWWRDVSIESGEHTPEVDLGLKIGMALFITSEVMFFFSFFWAFFHVSLVPAIELGGIWPPVGIRDFVVDAWGIPLLNTFLLLSSGVTVTCAHHAFLLYFKIENFVTRLDSRELSKFFKFNVIFIEFSHFVHCVSKLKKLGLDYLLVGIEFMLLTIVFAVAFTLLQMYEYVESLVRISDSVYGSTFFVMTGFHGLHVIIGTIFLIVSLIRIIDNQFYYKQSVGLESAIWYWHFVDVVWLFLFVSIYVWGNAKTDTALSLFPTSHKADFYWSFYDPFIFQDPATSAMEGLVDLHHNIAFFLIVIFIVVCWTLLNVIYHFSFGSDPYTFSVWDLSGSSKYNRDPSSTIIPNGIEYIKRHSFAIFCIFDVWAYQNLVVPFLPSHMDDSIAADREFRSYRDSILASISRVYSIQLKKEILAQDIVFEGVKDSIDYLNVQMATQASHVPELDRLLQEFYDIHYDPNLYEEVTIHYDKFIPIDEL